VTATGYGLNGRGLIPGRGTSILFPTASRHSLGSAQPIKWVARAPPQGVKRPGREVYHSYPSSSEVKNGRYIPPLPHTSS
jgi:hypothetical protein